MKILMLVDDLNIGGTATHVLSISKNLLKYNFEVLIISKEGQLDNRFTENNIAIKYLNLNENLVDVCNEIIDIIKKEKVDIIHTHLIKSIEIAYHIKKIANIDFISTLHILYYDENMINFLKYSKHIICVSEPIKEILTLNSNYEIQNKISVIYNSVDIKKNISKKKSDENKIITYCSRLNESKGAIAENLINEIYDILKLDNKLKLLILGDGRKIRNLKFYANNINNTLKRESIRILGNVDNVEDYFTISDCVIGTGRVAIEAINCETNCIAYGSSGFVGIVQPINYNKMIESYFGEHKKINKHDKTLLECINEILYSDYVKDYIKLNKKWCTNLFNEDKNIIQIINIYNK